MAKNPESWRKIRESHANRSFKLGSIFFWPDKNHHFIYLGPTGKDGAHCFFVMGSSQTYNDDDRNFVLVPEDFRDTDTTTQLRALSKTTYFIFKQYLEYCFPLIDLKKAYVDGTLEYKYNLKRDIPKAYDRLIYFLDTKFPKAYSKIFRELSNIYSD